MDKVRQLDDIIAGIKDGATIMFGGFLGVGSPLKSIEKIVASGVKDLTVVSVVNSYPGGGFDLAPLFKNRQVRKFVTAHTGTCPEAVEAMKAGDLDVDFFPMGTWIEKVRAAGAGLGGVLTPIGLGTLVEDGKQRLEIDGKSYLVEMPLRADYGFIAGYRADTMGNVEYRGVSLNSNPVIATAADFTVAEVNEIVEVGGIDPSRVGTPCLFVDAVVQGHSFAEHQAVFERLWVSTGRLAAPATAA
ncbi:CoA transferase subunit A [Rhodoplanes roseus]|uniref:Branched-chain amino acid dehydrogenase n=1 Tax=Rhodoplanes roseus TaxID=29409 RepID=A0A327L7D0_9BRAD|nr:CoA transferase subunit A [Rhodoplanes roseus]RAI45955.1 branched-chain amino acid dehydrogenase [Rhodoplanes roseus]